MRLGSVEVQYYHVFTEYCVLVYTRSLQCVRRIVQLVHHLVEQQCINNGNQNVSSFGTVTSEEKSHVCFLIM